jgi:hypothetical protein
MSKVIWHVTVSDDGFIAGPNGAVDWFADVGPNPAASAIVQSSGAVLANLRVIHRVPLQLRDRVRPFGQPGLHPIQLQPQVSSHVGAVGNLHCRVPQAA